MSQTLRDYQLRAIDGIREHLMAGTRRVLLASPTGSGKTTVAAAMIRGAQRYSNKVLFIAHRKELIDQCSTRLDGEHIDHGIIMANHPRSRLHLPVQVASVQTLINRETGFYPDIIVIDEAHRATAKSYETVIRQNPESAVIGLTATPIRSDGKGLGRLFDAMVECPSIRELTEMGHLVPSVMYSQPAPDGLKDVKVTAGDYNAEQLGFVMNKSKLVGDIVAHWKRYAATTGPGGAHRPTVVFAVNIAHSKSIVEEFVANGIRAEHLDGDTELRERERILHRLATGETQVVSNCGVLCEGWDSPSVSCVILARPTMSLGLYLQMAGRALRLSLGKFDCLILDHAGCFHRHGHVSIDREWTLDEQQMKKRAKSVNPGDNYKVCPECMRVAPLATRKCECGYEFAVKEQKIEQVDGELQLAEPVPIERPEQVMIRRRAYEIELARMHYTTKKDGSPFKKGYAAMIHRQQFNRWPEKGWAKDWEARQGEKLAQRSYILRAGLAVVDPQQELISA